MRVGQAVSRHRSNGWSRKASILLRGPDSLHPSLSGTQSLSAVDSEPAGEKAGFSRGVRDIALGNAAKPELPADCVVPGVASSGKPNPADLAVHLRDRNDRHRLGSTIGVLTVHPTR